MKLSMLKRLVESYSITILYTLKDNDVEETYKAITFINKDRVARNLGVDVKYISEFNEKYLYSLIVKKNKKRLKNLKSMV